MRARNEVAPRRSWGGISMPSRRHLKALEKQPQKEPSTKYRFVGDKLPLCQWQSNALSMTKYRFVNGEPLSWSWWAPILIVARAYECAKVGGSMKNYSFSKKHPIPHIYIRKPRCTGRLGHEGDNQNPSHYPPYYPPHQPPHFEVHAFSHLKVGVWRCEFPRK